MVIIRTWLESKISQVNMTHTWQQPPALVVLTVSHWLSTTASPQRNPLQTFQLPEWYKHWHKMDTMFFFPQKTVYIFSFFFFGSVVLCCPELIWMDFNRLHLSLFLASVLLWHFKNGSVYSNLKVSHKKKRFNFKNNVEKSTGLHRQVLYNVGDSRI